jgi:hypothetical protein
MRQARFVVSWMLALFLAVMFLWIADLTLFPPSPAQNVVFPALVEYSGFAWWEPTGRFAVGVVEVLAALLLLLPLTRRMGAILALLIALGAVAVHVLWLGVELPVEAGSTDTDGGQLFYLAAGLAAASAILAFVHPGREEAPRGPSGDASFYHA